MLKMKDINKKVKEWEDTEEQFLILKEKREALELDIRRIMIDNFWKDYTTNTGTHVSLTEEEIKDIDWNGLTILLNNSEIESVTKYSVEKKLLIVTPDGKKRIRQLIKQGK